MRGLHVTPFLLAYHCGLEQRHRVRGREGREGGAVGRVHEDEDEAQQRTSGENS